jgi:PAS domain S-box-containing protein
MVVKKPSIMIGTDPGEERLYSSGMGRTLADSDASVSLRQTGIEVIGDVAWGTHFCQFYQTQQDLIDTLVPYFKAGLDANEFCMWVTSEPLGVEQATQALREAVPDLDTRIARGQIEIVPHTAWYLLGGTFDQQRVLDGWVRKMDAALENGYAGLRLTGNTSWLEKDRWQEFTNYEEAVNSVIGTYRMLAVCTYSVDKCGAGEIADVIANHEFAIMKRGGEWITIESSTVRQAKQALQIALGELNDLNRALTDGADELEAANDELRAAEEQLLGEIDERIRAEEALHRLNRTLTAHSKSDQAMMRAQDESEYLHEVCRIVVEDCGHAMVWIGYAEQDKHKSVRPVAYSGFEEGYLETLGVTWADTERGRGPTGTAIRTGKPSTCRNMLTDPQFEPWREQAFKRGYASSIVLPLIADGKTFGAITIYSREPDPFTDDEVALLSGLADDLAYGITAIRLRVEHVRAEQALRESEQQHRLLHETMLQGVIYQDAQGSIISANPAAERILGQTLAELQRSAADHDARYCVTEDGTPFPGDEHPSTVALRTGQRVYGVVMGVYNPREEALRWISVDAAPLFVEGEDKPHQVYTLFGDITERKQAGDEIKRNEARLEGLLRISQHRAESIQEFLDSALEEAIALTGSKIGYIYHYDEAKREFTLNTWSKDVMEQCSVAEQQTVYALEKTGIWGEAVRQAKPIIINDFQAPHPLKKGYPEGHNPLCRFMTLPVFVGERIVGVVGVANKQTDYDNSDVRQLTLLMDSAWKFTERKRAEEALRESEQRVRRKLDSILLPEGDIGNLDLCDILDVGPIQSLMESFYKIAQIPLAILDLQGKMLVGVGWQDICTKFHRAHRETCKHCTESDLELTAGLGAGESKLYKCKNNMWDVATPVMIGGEHLGNLFLGQFFFEDEPLDYGLFRSQARQHGFNEEEYIAALECVPRLSRESLDEGMAFFMKLADMLSKLSYGNVKLARSLAERDAAQADAERRAAQLESFISSMVDGVVLFDSELRVLMINDALKKLLGAPLDLPLESYLRQHELYALDREQVPLADYPSRRALRGENTEAVRFRMITPWRESVVSISGSPVRDGHGRVVGGTLSFHDVTGLAELEEHTKELYRREHHIAEMLQQALIPPKVPTQIGDFRIGVRYQPALREAEVGGDFYDVFDLGNGKTGVLIGDVAGKGLAAAIRVAGARYAIRSYALIDPRPSRVMTLANEALCKDAGDEASMLTAFFAVIDTATARVTYTSAGHEPPVVCRDCGTIAELRLGGLPFGVKDSSIYEEEILDLRPGDTMVLVTDGITEARTADRVLFEKKGMTDYLAKNPTASPDEIASGLLAAATAYAGGQLQDDAAIVVVTLGLPGHAGCACSE